MSGRARNLYSDIFEAAFLAEQTARGVKDPAPYFRQKHDYIKLAELLKIGEEANWPISLERWSRGVDNYFRSEMGCYRSIAHLSSRFSAYYRSPLDQFGKPLNQVQKSNGKNSRAIEMMRRRYAEGQAPDSDGGVVSKSPSRRRLPDGR